jgi:aromatic-amino-acid transaminase
VAYLGFAKDQRSFLKHLAPLTERAAVLFAWSASKSFGLYGQRVGALIACTADGAQRAAMQNAMAYACRGTWSNCNAAGQHAVARCLTDASLDVAVRAERARLTALLDGRVSAFNRAAVGSALRYPRYDGGFFVTLFAEDAKGSAERLKARGVFTVPGKDSLRVALCSVPEAQVPALVDALRDCVR